MKELAEDPNEKEFMRIMNLPHSYALTPEENYFLAMYFRNKKETEIKHVTQALEAYYDPTIDKYWKAYKEKS